MGRSAKVVSIQFHPLPVVILAIDPGAQDGSAIFAKGKLVRHFPATRRRRNRDDVCSIAREIGYDCEAPLVAVVETWTGHGDWNFEAALGLAEEAGRWLDSLDARGVPKVVRVTPNQWRRALWKMPRATKRDVWKQKALDHARQVFGVEGISDNSAEAICIAHWGSRATAVKERAAL